MRKVIIAGFVLLGGVCATAGFSAEVAGLYEAEALVFSQQNEERVKVMENALAEVLVKVSGRGNMASAEGLQRAIKSPARYLQLYRYRQLSDAERAVLESARVEGQADLSRKAQMVSFRFDKTAVDKLLQDHNLPIWGSTRPSTLVWLAVQEDDHRYLLGGEEGDVLRQALVSEARRRGLALLLPLMDLQDQAALRFADVWGAFPQPVLEASTRYRTESVLMGRLYRGFGNKWRAQWTLIEGGRSQSWTVEADNQPEIMALGVAGATEILASQYAPVLTQQQAGLLPVLVTDVHNTADYSRVMAYLQSLQVVSKVVVDEVAQDRVTFRLGIKGSAAGVAKTIGLGNVLVPNTEVFVPAQANGFLSPGGNNLIDINNGGQPIPSGSGDALPLQAYRLLP